MLLRQGGIDLEHGMAWQPIGHFYLFANSHKIGDMRVSNNNFQLSLINIGKSKHKPLCVLLSIDIFVSVKGLLTETSKMSNSFS